MSLPMESAERFLRPSDVDRVRRNYRSIQVQRLVAVQHLEIIGAQHTTRSDLDAVRRRYLGTNLFTLDIARLRRDVTSLQWVSHVEIEKRLPDTLRVQIIERMPVAL